MSSYRPERQGMSTQTQTINVEDVPPLLQLRASTDQHDQEQSRQGANEGGSSRPSVRWESDVVDNENLNKKKTKICCIFHPTDDDVESACPSDRDEEPPSSSSSSSSESDEDMGLNFEERRARRVVRRRRKLRQQRSESPNAYEIQPNYTNQQSRGS